jgi:predicted dithiol-disulfide oxidoreductase (DUF899 family)
VRGVRLSELFGEKDTLVLYSFMFGPAMKAPCTSCASFLDGLHAQAQHIRHRTFTLTPKGRGVTEFEMTETFSGRMLPLIKRSLPDFGPAFETYAADLKRAAERSQ